MDHINRLHRRIPEIVIMVMLRAMLLRRWLSEAAIVLSMLVLLLAELSLHWWPGAHTVAHVLIRASLFGLVALWVYVNRAAFAAWEKQDTQERDRPC
jgi:hypothetical protein